MNLDRGAVLALKKPIADGHVVAARAFLVNNSGARARGHLVRAGTILALDDPLVRSHFSLFIDSAGKPLEAPARRRRK